MCRLFIKFSSLHVCKILCIRNTLNVKTIYKPFHVSSVQNFKQNLKKYPVVPLKETLDRFLKSVIPLLSTDELRTTACLAEDFGKKGGCGESLQELLKKRANCMENWLEEWWTIEAYLGYRNPVMIHSSPGLVFPLQKFCYPEDQIDYTARLIIAAMKYKHLIDTDKIPEEKMGKDALDMEQYKKLFGTCRIPKSKVDGIDFSPQSKHIVVCSNNNFFRLDLIDSCKQLISFCQLKCKLKKIMSQSCEKTYPIGVLSADQRDNWATNYKILRKDCLNAQHIKVIESSLFLVCLDKAMPSYSNINRLTLAGYQCIHGGGSEFNSGNRWFDKTIQFVIGNDGIVGLTYEHSPSEGQPVAVMVDFIVNNMSKVETDGPKSEDTCLQRLDFNVDCDLASAIKVACGNCDAQICNFSLAAHTFNDYGKNFIKTQKLSPDSFVQMAMQLSYYRMYCMPAAQYESAHCRLFKGGRTEAIRSCSVESVQFARAMLDTNCAPQEKRKLLEAAINSHKSYTSAAMHARGVDRHLFGLRKIAQDNNIGLHELYKGTAFIRSKHFHVSSSQVATKCPGFMCYGAVVNDGYGICYNPRDTNIFFGVGSFVDSPNTTSEMMSEHLMLSFRQMKDVLEKAPKKK